jgi:hypothetical protein
MKAPFIKKLLSIALVLVISIAAPAQNSQAVTDDITYTSNYLTDRDGYNYGGEFYLYNNSDHTIRVKYYLEGSSNVDIKSDGGITDVPPGEKVWIITVIQAGPDAWSSGTLHYSWE